MNSQLFTAEHLNIYRQDELRQAAASARGERVYVGSSHTSSIAATVTDLARRFAGAIRLSSQEARATVGH